MLFSQLLPNFATVMGSILIKDTTREERIRILNRSLGQCGGGCENCSSCWLGGGSIDGIYQDYIDGKRGFLDITMQLRRP